MRTDLTRLDFPEEAILFFEELNGSLSSQEDSFLASLQDKYMLCGAGDLTEEEIGSISADVQHQVEAWATDRGLSPYSGDMLFLIRCMPRLHEQYLRGGLDDERFYDICHDLTNKLRECKRRYGVYGTFVFHWFHRHFRMELFGLGRFQYERRSFTREDITFFTGPDGSLTTEPQEPGAVPVYTLHTGDTVYNFHIPSSGHLTDEQRLASYKMAYDFFGPSRNGIIPLICNSWLLWPDNRTLYPEGSNLQAFFDDFYPIASYEPSPERIFSDAWRIYYVDYTGDPDLLPRETSIQRSFAEYLREGGRVGSGLGVILFDGTHVLTSQNH
ncbi:MAG: DUF5596 domain-containing protein [Lachnospiraceae bacterium]|nr:DUF5596 domain-containing protein [Lachnospiraceae bacterium]